MKNIASMNKIVVCINPRYFRPAELVPFLEEQAKTKEEFGRIQQIMFEEMVAMTCTKLNGMTC